MENKKDKVTKRMVATNLLEYMANQKEKGLDRVGEIEMQDVIKYLENEISLLERKSNSNSKGKLHEEQDRLVELVYAELKRIGKPITATELLTASEEIQNFELESGLPMSLNKVSAMLKKLKDTGRVARVEDKRKSYFSITEEV